MNKKLKANRPANPDYIINKKAKKNNKTNKVKISKIKESVYKIKTPTTPLSKIEPNKVEIISNDPLLKEVEMYKPYTNKENSFYFYLFIILGLAACIVAYLYT